MDVEAAMRGREQAERCGQIRRDDARVCERVSENADEMRAGVRQCRVRSGREVAGKELQRVETDGRRVLLRPTLRPEVRSEKMTG